MSWLAHGISNSGFLQDAKNGQSKTVPAVAAYRGRLWCLWSDLDGQLWYAVTNKDGQFGPRQDFPQDGLPVMTNLNGHLHAIITVDSGEMVHYLFDDEEKLAWENLGSLDAAGGIVAHSSPALVAFHNKLFLVYLKDGQLYYVIWTNSTAHPTSASNPSGSWSAPHLLAKVGQKFSGIPALFVIDGVLHMLCTTADKNRDILGYRFDYITSTWSASDDVSEGRAVKGVSATSYGNNAYLGFIESGPGDDSHRVYVAAYSGGKWQQHEAVDGQSAADPPQIAILNGRIHCIFNDNTPTRDLRWYSRPILGYSLSSWMGRIPDTTNLCNTTVPGTHDSCARSNIPFVRTQYLSISQQLALGIRFLDLRLRTHDDGKLYCYHGGIPIDLPRGLSFASVMDEVWTFLRGPDGKHAATETVLISINNDDTSPSQRENPAHFYSAIAATIAATPAYPDGQHRWFAEPTTPTLGQVRGRAVLLRRFRGDPAVAPGARLGLDLSAWLDDNPNFTIVTPTNVQVHLQDKWKYADRIALKELVASKQGFVRAMMEMATRPSEDHWFLNFCSAVGDPVEHGEIAEAKWIAVGAHSDWIGKWVNGMNVLTREHLQQDTDKKRLGIVNLDYPELPEDNDLVARLIETNF
jgi:hypothetical protein